MNMELFGVVDTKSFMWIRKAGGGGGGGRENGSLRVSMRDSPFVGIDPITLNKLFPICMVSLAPRMFHSFGVDGQ